MNNQLIMEMTRYYSGDPRHIYGDSAGHHQELEGPAVAENMMVRLGYEEDVIKRVCHLVGHHHTYQDIEGLDYQILVEADFLVNLYENGSSKETAREVLYRVFVTESGKDILRNMFLA